MSRRHSLRRSGFRRIPSGQFAGALALALIVSPRRGERVRSTAGWAPVAARHGALDGVPELAQVSAPVEYGADGLAAILALALATAAHACPRIGEVKAAAHPRAIRRRQVRDDLFRSTAS
jgi:hypothetical protein